jgi:hypothetical protein
MKPKFVNILGRNAAFAVVTVLAILLAAVTALRADPPLPGAIFTTDPTCSGVDLNIYSDKHDVYLNGGPSHPGAASLPDGSYYVQVTDPSGACVLGTSVGAGNPTPFVVTNGVANCIQLCTVLINGTPTCYDGQVVDPNCGYNDTGNPGGEYKVWVSNESSFTNNSTKTDNFKVRVSGPTPTPTPPQICVHKFYDANVDGNHQNTEPEISGWQFQLFADDNLLLVRETPRCMVVDVGTYHVLESTSNEAYWIHTNSPQTGDFTVDYGDVHDVWFGNVCLGGGTNARTIGFWSNKNGQNLETSGDFTMLTSLCLHTGSGGNQDFLGNLNTNKAALNTFLLGATAVNMANMLSAQLAAMELNVAHGFVSGSALVYAGSGCGNQGYNNQFITITDLMNAANAELCAHPYTPAGNQYRAYQECLKNALDNGNNNLNFVQPGPGSCGPFTFPVLPQ